MSYLTQADLEAHVGQASLIQLTDHQRNGQVDAAAVNHAMTAANAEMDAWLSVRYTLPITPTPPLLLGLACDLALWHLTAARKLGDVEAITARYDRAIKTLERISQGKMALGLETTTAAASTPDEGILLESTLTVWGRQTTPTIPPDWMVATDD